MPDRARFLSGLARHRRRQQVASAAWAFVVAALATAATTAGLSVSSLPPATVRWASIAVGMVVLATLVILWSRSWSLGAVARVIEYRNSGLDNLVVTAEEILRTARTDSAASVRDVLYEQAARRLDEVPPSAVQRLSPLAIGAIVAALATTLVLTSVPGRSPGGMSRTEPSLESATYVPSATDLRVVVTPPAYTRRPSTDLLNPFELDVLEGSAVRLETSRGAGPTELVEGGRAAVLFDEKSDRWQHEFVARDSAVLLLRRRDPPDGGRAERLLQVRVQPDRRPVVRILTPAKDLVFGVPSGEVPIEIEARDDLRLGTLTLRYTKVTGSGETFSFEEGEVPVKVREGAADAWHGEARLTLDRLKLADGDTLVYRAIATDTKPGAEPSTSDTFLIEIGRLAGAGSTGFAIDEARERQGLSQQMLIVKTERLHAARGSLPPEEFHEQSRLLAVEQRMVKAEFVFMTGGEVADEVQEAEHAHELVEGRFENAAQVELLTAIREMSRAEARLNAADTDQALTYERAALRALQRAFDRRRYLLRTLPERARIDLSRRLSGDVATVRVPRRPQLVQEHDPTVAAARRVMAALVAGIVRPTDLSASLASEVLAVAPASKVLQQASITMAAAQGVDERVAAARVAHHALTGIVRERLAASALLEVPDAPIHGRFADEVRRLRQ